METQEYTKNEPVHKLQPGHQCFCGRLRPRERPDPSRCLFLRWRPTPPAVSYSDGVQTLPAVCSLDGVQTPHAVCPSDSAHCAATRR